jgi:hypothetical protein
MGGSPEEGYVSTSSTPRYIHWHMMDIGSEADAVRATEGWRLGRHGYGSGTSLQNPTHLGT